MPDYEIAIIGGGPAGLIAALAAAQTGHKIALIAPSQSRSDHRTTALMDHSIAFLSQLGLWQDVKPHAAPLQTMRIIDGTGRLVRAPSVNFRSAEINLDAFGFNIPNSVLVEKLIMALNNEPNLTHFDAAASKITESENTVSITLHSGDVVHSELVVGADGRKSMVRESADIAMQQWTYRQAAIVLNFQHSLSHDNISTEFHTRGGPFTQVPLPDKNRSSLVWVQDVESAETMAGLNSNEINTAIEKRMQSILGAVKIEEPIQKWPLSSAVASRFGKGRKVLIGEAAHAFPPIGAQGLNLSLRDIMQLVQLLGDSDSSKISINTGDHYNRLRKADVWSRTASVDLLNRSLLTDFLPAQLARATGLKMLSTIPPLRQFAMREGVQPLRGLKALL